LARRIFWGAFFIIVLLVTTTHDTHLSLQTLLGLADEALYQANDWGGNCVVISKVFEHPEAASLDVF
jgi:PleD family two-component response regulator